MAVTHELKTPLASMKLYLETMQSAKVTEDNKRKVIPKIGRDLTRLEGLVENILEAGRFSRSAVTVHKTEFDFSRLVGSTLDDFSDRARLARIRLESSIEPEIRVEGDPAVVRKSLEALLDNAAKYGPGESAQILTELKRNGQYAELSIRDQGIGLEKKELEAIFQRFYRVGNELTRTSPGSGLGLYLAREMIKANGGEIVARSEGPGQGAEFIIRLPVTTK